MNEENKRPVRPGAFPKGVSGNPKGRPRKKRSVDDAVIATMHEKVPVRGSRKRTTRLEVTTTRLANKGAEGDLRAAKLSIDYLQKAEERRAQAELKAPQELTESDVAIVARLIGRLKRIAESEGGDAV
ncbi:hypothetical protein BH09PSE2_BH09PSE2_06180 [soil metagenome]